jgi:hypothetical protein
MELPFMIDEINEDDHVTDNFLNISGVSNIENQVISNPMINNWTKSIRQEKNVRMKLMKSMEKEFSGTKKKLVKQSNLSTFEIIKSVMYGLRIAGVDCYQFQVLENSSKSSIKSAIVTRMFSVWHSMIQIFLIISLLLVFSSIIFDPKCDKMSAYVLLIRFTSINYNLVRYKLLKHRLKTFLEKLESSMKEFPDLIIEENRIVRLVIMLFVYAIAQSK